MRRRLSILARQALAALGALALSAGTRVAAAQQASAASVASAIRPLAYSRAVLPNGLVALFNEDHSLPAVVVDVWYHIGSKDDRPGRTGVAHLCEHLMAEGSPHVDQPQRVFYQSLGGTSSHSAITTEDITHYYVSVPSNALETVLWAESDRMAAPLSLVDSARIARARAVITREREQNVENYPFGVYRELTVATLFPEGHPYHLVPLPPVADLYGATASDLRQACLPYYVPNNAVISISGDFDRRAARAWIDHYFGTIPRAGAPVHAPLSTPTLARDARLVLEDARANQPRIHFDWVGASFDAPDRLALNALGSILTLPRFGRLSKLLVDDRKLATNVVGGNADLEKSGVFELIVFPRPGASLSVIETLVDSVIAALPTTVVQREIDRFNSYNADSAITWLQTRFARADTLAHGEVFAHDPVAYARQVDAARALTPARVQQAAATYLRRPHVVMSLVPAGKLELVSKPDLPYTNVTPPSSVQRAAPP